MKSIVLLVLLAAFASALHTRTNRGRGHKRLKSTSQNRIVGGAPVDIADYGWQVSLQKYDAHHCGGSIISEDWILSAAHCFDDDNVPKHFSIRIGSSRADKGGEILSADKLIRHPKFNGRIFDNDAALIHVSTPIEFNNGTIRAATLVAEGNKTPVGTLTTVTGWGYLNEQEDETDDLQGVNVPIISWDVCQKAHKRLSNTTICAGYKEGVQDSCNGDSGGPLMLENDKTVIGIVSWGVGCARPDSYGMYTDISAASVRSFIREHTNV